MIARTIIRNIYGCHNSVPVEIDSANPYAWPEYHGEPGGHFTRGGTPIAHPNAYAKSGWSNMVYRCSTERITVGSQVYAWIERELDKRPRRRHAEVARLVERGRTALGPIHAC